MSDMAIYHQLTNTWGKIIGMVMQEIIPAGAAISELKQKAAECEAKAKHAPEPEAAKLSEEALLYREWISALRSGKWCS